MGDGNHNNFCKVAIIFPVDKALITNDAPDVFRTHNILFINSKLLITDNQILALRINVAFGAENGIVPQQHFQHMLLEAYKSKMKDFNENLCVIFEDWRIPFQLGMPIIGTVVPTTDYLRNTMGFLTPYHLDLLIENTESLTERFKSNGHTVTKYNNVDQIRPMLITYIISFFRRYG